MGKIIQFPGLFGQDMKSKVLAYYKIRCSDKEFLDIIDTRLNEFLALPAFQQAKEPLNIENITEEEAEKMRGFIHEIIVSLGRMCQEVLDLELELYKKNKKNKRP